jgi:hypothetical protein
MEFAAPDRFIISPPGLAHPVQFRSDRRHAPRDAVIVETFPGSTRIKVFPSVTTRGPREGFVVCPRPELSKTWRQQTAMTTKDESRVRAAFTGRWPLCTVTRDNQATVTVEMWCEQDDAIETAWRRLWEARDSARAELEAAGYSEVDLFKPWPAPRIGFQYRRDVPL